MSVDMHSVHQLIRYSSEYKADFDEGLRTQAHTHTSHSLSFIQLFSLSFYSTTQCSSWLPSGDVFMDIGSLPHG